MSTEKQYCCSNFECAVAAKVIIDEEDYNRIGDSLKCGGWWFSSREYNPWMEKYEYQALIAPIKYCPWCRKEIQYRE